jgi:hypothetical protein
MTSRALEARGLRHILSRIQGTPQLVQVVQALEPRVLYELVRHCGLEDCGEIVSLATSEQLVRIFDDDLWRSDAGGDEDQFDADRFGLWLEVLVEADVAAAAQKIALMDFDFVAAALSRHLLVLDQDSLLFGEVAADPGANFDPLENARAVMEQHALENTPSHEVGGFGVIAKRGESWDALLSLLIRLEDEHRPFFGRLMKRCSQLSTEYLVDNGGLWEVLTSDEQMMADISGDREQRREEAGYVSPSQAAAFLKLSRARGSRDGGAAAESDPVSARYFRELRHEAKTRGEGSFAREAATEHPQLRASTTVLPGPRGKPPLLTEATTPDGNRLARIRAQLQLVLERDAAAYSRRTEELAYLANVLIAGCSFASRRFRDVEAADAVLAVCNLGLENWPRGANTDQDLVAVFRIGWSVLYEQVSMQVAKRLVAILAALRPDDEDLRHEIRELRRGLKAQVAAGTPWRERDNLDVIAILDPPSWATLHGLVDECPVVPKAREPKRSQKPPLRVSSEFEFISENRQIAWVRDFMDALPGRLAEP